MLPPQTQLLHPRSLRQRQVSKTLGVEKVPKFQPCSKLANCKILNSDMPVLALRIAKDGAAYVLLSVLTKL
jgi:hypothetical protein